MNIIKHRNIFFIISGLLLLPGLISLFMYGLVLGIDFTGGSRIEMTKSEKTTTDQIKKVIENNGITVHSFQDVENTSVQVRTEPMTQQKKEQVVTKLTELDSAIKEQSFETVGPTIGSETTQKAFIAVVIASLVITAYIAIVFRAVSKPLASWKYGVAAVVGLIHDVILVIGVFSLLGKFLNVEIDALFITAVLTVMGFSVHDTIVVFDRIRENLKKYTSYPYEEVVNMSLMETFNRSVNTSLTVIIVLFTLLLFSGESVRWFVFALLIGIVTGTYSSLFNASPLLVVWNNWDKRKKNKVKKKK